MVKISFDTPEPSKEKAFTPPQLTAAAAKRILALTTAENEPATCLRVAILGGGCNGFSYHFKLEETIKEADKQLTHPSHPTAIVVLDADSYSLLDGATIDFQDTLEASQFIITNPNATSSCGCGNSFGL